MIALHRGSDGQLCGSPGQDPSCGEDGDGGGAVGSWAKRPRAHPSVVSRWTLAGFSAFTEGGQSPTLVAPFPAEQPHCRAHPLRVRSPHLSTCGSSVPPFQRRELSMQWVG